MFEYFVGNLLNETMASSTDCKPQDTNMPSIDANTMHPNRENDTNQEIKDTELDSKSDSARAIDQTQGETVIAVPGGGELTGRRHLHRGKKKNVDKIYVTIHHVSRDASINAEMESLFSQEFKVDNVNELCKLHLEYIIIIMKSVIK